MLKVNFRTHHLQERFEKEREGIRAWGPIIARHFIKRVKAMQAAERFDDLARIPSLKFHPLKGDRQGQFAISITGRARLILIKEIVKGIATALIVEVDPEHYGD